MKSIIIIFIGGSGSGKTELQKYMINHYSAIPLISCTNRFPRKNEINEIDYYFKTTFDIKNMINNNEFIEYTKYNKNYYGTTYNEINCKINKSKYVVNVMEINGALKIKELYPNQCYLIYCYCPLDILLERMENRGDSQEKILDRKEIFLSQKEDENKQFADYIIDNSQLLKQSLIQLDFILNQIKGEKHEK